MATTISEAFTEFETPLRLTHVQRAAVTARRDATTGYVSQAFPATSDVPLSRTKLIGSAARDTIIRPLDDVDLMGVFENKSQVFEKYRNDSRAFLYRVRDALSKYSQVQVVGARGQAVRFFYKEAPHVDVAPMFKWSGSGYGLPNGRGGWLTTDPDAHEAWFADRVQKLGSNLGPMVRMIKQGNRSHSRYLKSFHIEVMVGSCFITLASDSRAACEKFFQAAQTGLRVIGQQ